MAKKDKADKDRGEKKKGKKKEPPAFGVLSATVTQVARSLRTRLSHGLSESGLYPGQDGVVQLLAQEDGQTPGALAHQLGVKAPTMTRTIGRMEAQGFVQRRTDDRDGRLTKVYLTDEGRGSVTRIAEAMVACESQAVKGLSAKELKTLVKLLAVIDDNLSGQTSGHATELADDDD
ncbi:MarR family transcriptional regulator [Rhizobium sp. AQ_MP]|uniref:MarR family winged helix-turn-helix transcriptional regulator n=1 Tax=Rhizobium sp. AQ_MP TaxID=2761536 RepID=UPI00163A2197|nr:MarR family transcriptional regulator [Rhizobium sp. AQ_MP]MBC2772208.1 MarR family transcriptional regulator [Rhizobium sp. AQ_MP]